MRGILDYVVTMPKHKKDGKFLFNYPVTDLKATRKQKGQPIYEIIIIFKMLPQVPGTIITTCSHEHSWTKQ